MLLTAVALAGAGGACYYQYTQLQTSQERTGKLKAQLLDEKGLQRKVDESLGVVEEAEQMLEHLEKGVPQFAYVPTMLRELEEVGKSNGCLIYGVKPKLPKAEKPKKDKKTVGKSPAKSKKPYTELEIEVTGRGQYGRILSLVTALEGFPKIIAVRAVDMTPKKSGKDDESVLNLEFTLSIRAFAFPPEPAPQQPAEQPTAGAGRSIG
ncbi:MAG: hypothetical protein HONBIEJF_01237 [Fimbriimonadaceae bacterium]|nr:hypothetical protein [Fimbriimonadaceae bacterium]